MADAELRVEVVSKTTSLWRGRATYVSVPATDGHLGVLVGRQPVLAVLQPGNVEITTGDGEVVLVSVASGFVSVDSDFVTIVVDGGEVKAA